MTIDTQQQATVSTVVSGATYLGVTLAEANEVVQFVVGVLTAISLVVLIAVKLKELRK